MERDFHNNVLWIGDTESDMEFRFPPFDTFVSGGPLRPPGESKTWSASWFLD